MASSYGFTHVRPCLSRQGAPSGFRITWPGFTRAATESLNTTMRAIARMSWAFSVSSSARTLGMTPAVPAFFRTISSCDGMFSPNSSFTSITNALISVESAMSMSRRIRLKLCAANRFT